MSTMSMTSSGLLTASAQVTLLAGRLHALVVTADGTNVATVTVHDSENSTTTGKVLLATIIVPAGQRFDNIMLPEQGVDAGRGLYCTITGTGANAIVYYSNA